MPPYLSHVATLPREIFMLKECDTSVLVLSKANCHSKQLLKKTYQYQPALCKVRTKNIVAQFFSGHGLHAH